MSLSNGYAGHWRPSTPARPTDGSETCPIGGPSGGTPPPGWSTGRSACAGGPPSTGPRHLLQLVALKRRQAEGRTLAEIQAELAGASDAALTGVARVPEKLLAENGRPPAEDGPVRTRFWADAPAEPAGLSHPGGFAALQGEGPHPDDDPAAPVGGVRLGRGAILVLPGLPTEDERREITAAARPLLRATRRAGTAGT